MISIHRMCMSAVALTAAFYAPVHAFADNITMSATYYTIAESDPDMGTLAGGVFNNEVQNALGPNGLPVLNTATYGCTSNCFTATPLPTNLTANGQITWWSTSNPYVTQTGTGTVTLPYSNGSFYAPNGTGSNDANGYQSAFFSATLNVPTTESISFNVGADDTAFVYLDNSIVCDLGGVHADSPGTCTSSMLTVGSHTLDLFFADLHQVGSALTFDVTTSGVTGAPPPPPTTGTPEPASVALLASGLIGLALVRLRRSR